MSLTEKRVIEFCQHYDNVKTLLSRYDCVCGNPKIQDTVLQLVIQLICVPHGGVYDSANWNIFGHVLGCGCHHDQPVATLEQIRNQPYCQIDYDSSQGLCCYIDWEHEAMNWPEVVYYLDLLEWQVERVVMAEIEAVFNRPG